MKTTNLYIVVAICLCASVVAADFDPEKLGDSFTNSIGMKMVRIDPGSFAMGYSKTPLPDELTGPLSYPTRDELIKKYPHGDPDKFEITIGHVINGDLDEKPAHNVTISQPFYMGAYEVTNAQYEKFDPSHRKLRGKNGFSKADDEAVVFVNWPEAKSFCDWLSKKEGLPYRLPTEAQWEYACRAGTKTYFWTGDSLPKVFHKNVRRTSFDQPQDKVPLNVGKTPPNPWGLYDMHGNVEEWCYDWYGPYESSDQTDPVGRIVSDFKVTRGGSHGTNLYFLRSANRLGTLPENRQWLIGLRVIVGELAEPKPLPEVGPQPFQLNVNQKPHDWSKAPDPDKPYFKGPRKYVRIPKGMVGPVFYHHNHDAGIVECPNGDLLTIWYTCVLERGRELAIAASRLRYGADQWEQASLFWDAPDRNDHCPAVWYDGKDTIYHFNGLNVAGKWEPLAIIMRTSKDNGATWSKARIIAPEHNFHQMVGEPVFRTQSGAICLGADAEHGSTIWISEDEGKTWYDPGGHIRGIHAGIAEMTDGRIIALGRNENINGWMPKSISSDMGKTWEISESPFQGLTGGQRATLIRLKEGPLFFASFAKDPHNMKATPEGARPPRHISSLFGALSYDDGKTWPVRRVISASANDTMIESFDNAPVLMNANTSEPLAYLSSTQSPDGIIHLVSSTNHFEFNIAWLKQKPKPNKMPLAKPLPARAKLAPIYNPSQLPTNSNPKWHFLTPDTDEKTCAAVNSTGLLNIKAPSRWSNERTDGFEKIDVYKGLTAEVELQVQKSSGDSGFDFEVFIRAGTLQTNHYRITITTDAVYYLYDRKLIQIAKGLDNSSKMHKYRLSVRKDTAVQIYRDNKLLSVKPIDLLIDWDIPARGSYIEWATGENTQALVKQIRCDYSGPYTPK